MVQLEPVGLIGRPRLSPRQPAPRRWAGTSGRLGVIPLRPPYRPPRLSPTHGPPLTLPFEGGTEAIRRPRRLSSAPLSSNVECGPRHALSRVRACSSLLGIMFGRAPRLRRGVVVGLMWPSGQSSSCRRFRSVAPTSHSGTLTRTFLCQQPAAPRRRGRSIAVAVPRSRWVVELAGSLRLCPAPLSDRVDAAALARRRTAAKPLRRPPSRRARPAASF